MFNGFGPLRGASLNSDAERKSECRRHPSFRSLTMNSPHTGYPMLDLVELAVSSADELIKKRCQLVEELALLDALIEHVRQVPADHVRELVTRSNHT
jgi:hypothetical protein